ncbi:MAG TPA: metalloregulator ArsR/SmtB family transcription factor [Bryobacteraceae bacterium]|jgi:DNA-binding transcriptional ArsR family regulator|nr:metalloregulator ArsR/SmtB family transcription factor [Bryobacteraceae bacterium]
MAAEAPQLDAVFGALSDPIRRSILAALARGEASVTALGQPFSVSAPAITKHLHVLETAGLIVRRKSGRVNYCRLRTVPLAAAAGWIEEQRQFWERQFDALDRYLSEEDDECNPQPSNEPGSPSASNDVSAPPGRKSSARGRSRKS